MKRKVVLGQALRVGVDMIEAERVADTVDRFGARFLDRVFTPAEQEYCGSNHASLAARWAAKEAVAKALGCGIGDVTWREIEVLSDERGAPHLELTGDARRLADECGLHHWSLSISHSRTHAIAFVVGYASTEL